MDFVDIIFTRSNKIGSRLIRSYTWSNWSHCSLIDGDDVIEAALWYGVRVSPLESLKSRSSEWEVKRFPVKDAEKFKSFMRSQVGKKYDYLGALGIALRLRTEKRNRWSCAELLVHAALKCGSSWFKEHSLHKISPQDIYQLNYDWLLQESS